jgi:hypothetical protein
MKTIKITKQDLDKDNFYKYDGIGEWDNYEYANVEIEEGLGIVKFKKGIYVIGSIIAKADSGIEAGWGIKAGSGIEAGSGIKAGWAIEAGEGIKAGEGIICLYGGIKAGSRIKVNEKCGIVAGIFSDSGEKDIEAQEIIGTVAYGNVKLLPKENKEIESLSGKVVKVELDGKTYEAVIK